MTGQLPGDAITAETLGRLVRDTWVAWAREQTAAAAAVFTVTVPTAWVVIRTLRMCRK